MADGNCGRIEDGMESTEQSGKPKIRSLLDIDPWRDVPGVDPGVSGAKRQRMEVPIEEDSAVGDMETSQESDLLVEEVAVQPPATDHPVQSIPSLLDIDPFHVPGFPKADSSLSSSSSPLIKEKNNISHGGGVMAKPPDEDNLDKSADCNGENIDVSSIHSSIPSLLDINPFGGRLWPAGQRGPAGCFHPMSHNRTNIPVPMRQIQPNAGPAQSTLAKQDDEDDVVKNSLNSEKAADLLQAVQGSDAEKVNELLAGGVNVNVYLADGSSALISAVNLGNKDMVKLLLSHGADVNKQDRTGATPLHALAKMSNSAQLQLKIADILFENLASTDLEDYEGCSALHLACKLGNTELVKVLLPKCNVNKTCNDGSSLLHLAAKLKHVEIARLLSAAGANPNIQDSAYETPLIIASRGGDSDMVRVLLSTKCHVNTKGFMEYTALHWAVHGGYGEVTQQLLDTDIDLNAQSALGRSPLHRAVAAGHVAITKQLLLAGSNTELVDGNGETPLVTATRFGFMEMVRILLQFNANPDPFGLSGKTPLIKAILSGYREIAELLVKVDCDVSLLHLTSTKLLSGGRLSWLETKENVQAFIEEHPNLLQPRKLKQLCRSNIRNQLRYSGHYANQITVLPVPEAIQSYISLTEELSQPTNSEAAMITTT